jgi:hypothetical protein
MRETPFVNQQTKDFFRKNRFAIASAVKSVALDALFTGARLGTM